MEPPVAERFTLDDIDFRISPLTELGIADGEPMAATGGGICITTNTAQSGCNSCSPSAGGICPSALGCTGHPRPL